MENDTKSSVLSPSNNTAKAKAVRTFLQSVGASIVAYLYGLWQLPGVSEYTQRFLQTQGLDLLVGLMLLVGIPAAAIAYVQNRRAKV